jgi:sulfur-oxidizing protein SoxA
MANGTAFNVDTKSKEAKAAIERGTKLFERKVGQLNFACNDCHSADKGANKWIRGQYLGELKGQVDHFPLWRTSRGEIWDIRKRLQWCNVAVRANELPPEASEYGDIELALTAMSNGMKLSAPGIRH